MPSHYFTVAPRADYYAPETDPQTAWEEKPQGVTHYMPSAKIGLDTDGDGNIDGIGGQVGETPANEIDWLTPLLIAKDIEIGFNRETNTFNP